jgi:glycosyltransferase involved in cell wall biosynthesis
MHQRISVVIPVYNSAAQLQQCLASLQASEEPPFECIVVDDGSTDTSAEIASRYGARVLSTGQQSGPARARNIGAKAASGDILLFLDADVCVRAGTTARIASEFARDPLLDGLIGSYDDLPSAQNFVSQYRNLMHHFVHQNSSPQATTFWAGCGAIRRQVFLDFGGFDEKYSSPAIEDIELGYRLSQAGRKLLLLPDLQVKHLKHWGFRSMLKADFFYRALPWSELALQSGRMPNDLNLRISQRISVGLVFVLICLGTYSTLRWHAYFITPLFATFFLLLSSYWIENLANRSRTVTAMIAANIVLIVGLSWVFRMYAIIPMVLVACFAMFVQHRYAYSPQLWRRRTALVLGAYCLLVAGLVWIYFPWAPIGSAFLVLMLTLLVLNIHFYAFLAGSRGKLFALSAIPFHLLYFASSGMAFAIALLRHGYGRFQNPGPVPAKVHFPAEPAKADTVADSVIR